MDGVQGGREQVERRDQMHLTAWEVIKRLILHKWILEQGTQVLASLHRLNLSSLGIG